MVWCLTAIFAGLWQVRATKEIAAGEALYVSYIDVMQPTALRRAELSERYFFKCECPCCTSDPNIRDAALLAGDTGGNAVDASTKVYRTTATGAAALAALEQQRWYS